jgi:hypothetical protein
MNKQLLIYRFTITIIFIYIFIQFLTMKRTNFVYKFYSDYIMNKYCIILYILLILIVMRYDSYTAVILFILVMVPFKFVYKEYFKSLEYFNVSQTTTPQTTTPQTTTPQYIIQLGTDEQTQANLLALQYLGVDDRFKMDDIKKDEILKQIASQIEFDPYKTSLSKDVINEIYGKYFDNDIFIKLKKVNDDSKQYIASGNFPYLPKDNKVDFDLVTYQNLSNNTQLGINPISDGIKTNSRKTS